jgi:PAS domain S-box-containing protein
MLLDPNTPDGIPIIFDANDAACRAHGYEREDFIGRPVADIDDEEGKRLVKKRTKEIMTGKPFHVENIHVRKNGSTFPVAVNANRIDIGGRKPLILTIEYDITEKRKLEEQLRQAQKMEAIGTLAGGIAHDFNNILSSILGFTELALDEVEKESSLAESMQEVYSAGKRAKELVKQILAFARKSDETKKPVRLSAIAQEIVHLLRSSIPTTIQINPHFDSDSVIMGNATQLHQIIMNLCTNAAHAMEEKGGQLTISIKDFDYNQTPLSIREALSRANYMQLQVADTGAGIAPETIGSIFEPYFTTKSTGEGTGMGLAMVQGIVVSYGGRITVESTIGEGTIFTIYLPISTQKIEDHMYVPASLPTGTERVLFVDDEAAIAKMGGMMLENLGYKVSIRTSSNDALELFKTRPNEFDVIITDMTMPDMTGEILASEMIKIRADISVIVCTGYSRRISDETIADMGIKAMLHKPFVKADLARTVRKVLDENKTS